MKPSAARGFCSNPAGPDRQKRGRNGRRGQNRFVPIMKRSKGTLRGTYAHAQEQARCSRSVKMPPTGYLCALRNAGLHCIGILR
jgi:hypothetical protein